LHPNPPMTRLCGSCCFQQMIPQRILMMVLMVMLMLLLLVWMLEGAVGRSTVSRHRLVAWVHLHLLCTTELCVLSRCARQAWHLP
jgi:hypothetical protein